MADMDPVPWDDIEAASGPPTAAEVVDYVEAYVADRTDPDPPDDYEAVKTVYDDWKADLGEERSLSDQGAAYVIAYLLERERIIDLRGTPADSLLKRRPDAETLRELFWDDGETLWWMAVELGVHYALVTFWLWEADVPLAERNLSDDLLSEIERDGAE